MTIIKNILLFTTLCLSSIVFCQSKSSDSQSDKITTFIKNVMEEMGIPGAAVAVIKDDHVVYKNYIGKANLEHNVPIADSSLFRLHSLSKIFVSVSVFQLIEQGKISLEDKISLYLSDLPDGWKDVRIKHLLSHSSGLPDIRDETSPSEALSMKNVYSKDIQFPFGERASYNQTNFWLLNRIIRKITNIGFQEHVTSQFEDNAKVCFSSIQDIIHNRVAEYNPNNKGQLKNFHFTVQEYMFGAAGITMSLEHLIDWDKKLNNNVLISEKSKERMFAPFQYKVGTGFSYGWDIQNINGIISYGFNGGGLVNYRNYPSRNISVIWFTNGYRKPHNIDGITNNIVGFVDKDLIDKTPEFIELLKEIVASNKPKIVMEKYGVIKMKYPHVNFERTINSLGYQYLADEKLDNAITMFKLNVSQFAESANTYDSLAEAYYIKKQYKLSKKNYLKSLELDPFNVNATKMISKIEEEK